MKRLLTLLTILISINCFGQELNTDSLFPKINETRTIERKFEYSATGGKLFSLVQKALPTIIGSQNIKLVDTASQTVLGYYYSESLFPLGTRDIREAITYAVSVETKDNKIRIRFYDFVPKRFRKSFSMFDAIRTNNTAIWKYINQETESDVLFEDVLNDAHSKNESKKNASETGLANLYNKSQKISNQLNEIIKKDLDTNW